MTCKSYVVKASFFKYYKATPWSGQLTILLAWNFYFVASCKHNTAFIHMEQPMKRNLHDDDDNR